MRMPKGAPARVAGTIVALCLLCGATAVAQQDPPADVGDPPGKEKLDQMLDVRSAGNEQSAGAQKRIDGISDETDALLAQYRTLLKQIDSVRIYNRQKNL